MIWCVRDEKLPWQCLALPSVEPLVVPQDLAMSCTLGISLLVSTLYYISKFEKKIGYNNMSCLDKVFKFSGNILMCYEC